MGVEEFLNIEEEHKREFSELLQYCLASGRIDQNLYQEYDVKRGLRDSSGKGVLTGLTEISDVVGYTYEDGRKIPADGQVVKSIVSTNLIDAVAASYNCKLVECLTGFKWIGREILRMETTGKGHYLFGFEESYGCLIGTHARDKDAIVASMALCEAAAYYKLRGKTIWDAMLDMYEKYGYYKDNVIAITHKGIEGLQKIQSIMDNLRKNPPMKFGNYDVTAVRDYLKDEIVNVKTGEKKPTGIPKSNVLYFELTEDAWLCVRPSGTEPKIKLYFGVVGKDLADADEKSEKLAVIVKDLLNQLG